MSVERPFTTEETRLMRRLVSVLMIHAPHIRPKSIFLPIDEMEFHWKHLSGNKRIEHPIWLVKQVYVNTPIEGDDVKYHIIRMTIHLVRQLYEQMDYKEHQFTHTIQHILYKDRLGDYRENYRKSVSFYRNLMNAYRSLKRYDKLGHQDLEKQYALKKELSIKYGKGFDLALEIYTQFHIEDF